MSNVLSIECYLLFDPWTYFLCIILDYKNSKFKHLIDDITIDLWYTWNFVSVEDIIRKCNYSVDLLKIKYNKKILNGVVALGYNQVWHQTLSNFILDWTVIYYSLNSI